MQFTRTSAVSGITRTLDLPVTPEQLSEWQAGKHAQHAFPACSAGQREFIMTGVTDEEWDEIFGDGEEDEDGA